MEIEMTRVEQAKREVIANIGQLTADDCRKLDKAVKNGVIARWRGHWHPIAGAPFGIGPLKVCYGPIESRDWLTSLVRS